jgi:hypothetical protein
MKYGQRLGAAQKSAGQVKIPMTMTRATSIAVPIIASLRNSLSLSPGFLRHGDE